MPTLRAITERLPQFKAWLSAHGASVGAPTNEWEVLRFTARNTLSVIYKNKVHNLKFMGMAEECWHAFRRGEDMYLAGERRVNRKRSAPLVKALRERDGDDCFYCLKPVMHADEASVEHLVALIHGGPNHMSNFALAHKRCNADAGHLSLVEKIKIREKAVIIKQRVMITHKEI